MAILVIITAFLILLLIKDPISDSPRRRVEKTTTIRKNSSSNVVHRNPPAQQRTHIATVDNSFDEANSYSSPSRQQPQPMDNNEDIDLSRIADRPLLPTFSDKIQHELLMGMLFLLYLDSIIFFYR
ncbi:unnamed protein product [Rotaria socialis]|uniref:Uncharacterized protein n=2 Tax=Rotaria socialis TaxID=392032 RepID=A0A817XWY2_9BILA|nr:unnamed protein product [Rotaria socialis]CAF3374540.1 unnamed protein product [Rotaria socialis]CAF3616766.1 unnamed protein product [Rotaria socialis]CAF4326761.1 unnamed protein product [Rotaria socialis]CAF4687823.1 unnamed protein product [Rotaria socialis]